MNEGAGKPRARVITIDSLIKTAKRTGSVAVTYKDAKDLVVIGVNSYDRPGFENCHTSWTS